MIVEFKVKNFRSYKDEIEFSFEALDSDFRRENVAVVHLEDGSQLRLLKTAALFGANASGKSNLIWALHGLSDMVAHSAGYDVNTAIPAYVPYAFDEESTQKPVAFSISFLVDGKQYRYDVIFDHLIHEEKLTMMQQGKFMPVFRSFWNENSSHRDIQTGGGWEFLAKFNGELLPNQLLLSLLGTKETKGLQHVYSFLATLQAEPVSDSINLKFNSVEVAEKILKDGGTKLAKQLGRLLHIADMGIEAIGIKKHDESEFKFPQSIPKEIRQMFYEQNKWEFSMFHRMNGSKKKRTILPLDYESTGTKNLFGLGARVLDVLDSGGVLAYDEINIAIHPALFHLIVSLFHSEKSNPHHAQLLFTTHDVSIAGDGMLRADQVWFAEKKDGASQLYSAQDFEDVGINIPFDAWYKAGRFGALPKFGNVDYIFGNDGTSEEGDQQE